MSAWAGAMTNNPDRDKAGTVSIVLTPRPPPVRSVNVMTKTRMAGIRADDKTLAGWARKAKVAGMSLNKWACLVLNTAPDVKPAALAKGRSR